MVTTDDKNINWKEKFKEAAESLLQQYIRRYNMSKEDAEEYCECERLVREINERETDLTITYLGYLPWNILHPYLDEKFRLDDLWEKYNNKSKEILNKYQKGNRV